MLASITPLGERGRDQRWGLTVTAYLLGSAVGGTLAGGALGTVGSWLPTQTDRARLLAFAAAAVLGLLLDARIGGWRLPTVGRQVDENWLVRYRGWVYGGGFGFQLGIGVVTVVTTSTVYLTLLLSLLSGSAAIGGLIGLTYGTVRAGPILLLARVRRPTDLRAAHRLLGSGATAASRAAVAVLGAVAVGAMIAGWPR